MYFTAAKNSSIF